VTVLCLVVVAFFGFGLTRITTSVKFERMFPSHSEIIQNYRWIEGHIGPLIPIEIIVGFDQRCSLDVAERLELVSTIVDSLRPIPETGGIISAATFAPPIPKASGLRAAIRRRIFVKRLEDGRHRFVDEGFLATDGDEEFWRVTARIPAVHDVDYGEFVSRVRQQVEPIVQSQQDRDIEGITVMYTGMSPLLHEAQQQLLDDLIKSFLIAFLLICPVMMIILRGFWPGLLSMIPNVVPAVIVFGSLGWLGIAVDIGTMLCASVGLGIAVDDTLHFLTWYARGIREGLTSHQAVRNAYHFCASAMFQTTLICGCGILVFSFSQFLPTSRFAWLMFILLWTALLGDLILLPALLAGPLGKVFARSQRQHTRVPEPPTRHSDG
jgi:predicted RND superfamily exporter protein